ncbi:4-hydroxy-tetrahydrodipicolinate synthase [subsurface metagenome]
MEKDKEKSLEWVIPALITLLNERGKIDFRLLEKQIEYLSSAGVHGFFINGTTGEGPYLTRDEKIMVYKHVREATGDKQLLCAACINPSTDMTIEEIHAFEALEPDFFVAVTPYYYEVPQEVIENHYRRIASASPFHIIMYNIPQCTHNKIEFETILNLTSEHNIRGIKDSSGDFITFSRGHEDVFPEHFSWIQGEDFLDGASLILGAHGLVTGLGNIWIEPYVELYREAKRGNASKVNDNQNKINRLYEIIRVTDGKAIPSIKAAVSLLGRSEKWTRLQSYELSNEETAKVKDVLSDLELL